MKKLTIAGALFLAAGFAVTGLLRNAGAQATASASAIPPAEAASLDRLNKSPRHGEWVEIKVAGRDKPMRSYVVYPERPDKAPVVLVIMEIFGMSDWVRATTDQLAADGFIAIAPDFLTGKGAGGVDPTPDQARGMVGQLKDDEVMTALNASRDYGMKLPASNGKTATIGFCWGGGKSFNFAAAQPGLNAAVVFYGTPPADDLLPKIKAPVAGFYGGNDARITATVDPTKEKMVKLGKTYEPHVYEGAGHGFMRQQTAGPNLKGAQEAWPLVVKFIRDNTK